MNIPVKFKPREYQQRFLEAMERGVRLAVLCWARRGGKDFTCFGYAVKKMVEQPMNVVLVFPTKTQGRDAFWDNVENDGFKTIEHIPQHLIAAKNNEDMKITLFNGSTFQVLGTTEPDKLRGANAKLYIFSEFVDIDSAAYDVVVPVTEVNGGQIVVQSTPKIDGISGGTFKMMFDDAEKDPNEFASLVTAHEYLNDEQLARLRQKNIKKYGNDFFFRQEFLCDWGQASAASYYGGMLQSAIEDGRVGYYPYNRLYPVYTVWDWGMSDNTAIGFFQFYLVDGKPRVSIVDAYETSDIGIKQLTAFVKAKPYDYAWHFFPHDTSVRDSDAIQRIEKFRDEGLINSSILPRESRDDGIERVVSWLPSTVFNEIPTDHLRRKLGLYKRKFNTHTGDYVGAEHNSASHYADMIRYMMKAVEEEFDQKTCELYGSQVDDVSSSEELATTYYYEPAF